MTAEEEILLKSYLGLDGAGFEDWYRERYVDKAADQEYKSVLSEARANAGARADSEYEARIAAEARIRELEAELERRGESEP